MADMGKWIGYYRKVEQLSENDVAEKLNISLSAYKGFEQNLAVPDEREQKKLVKLFKIEPWNLKHSPTVAYQEMLYNYSRIFVLGDADNTEMFWEEFPDEVVFRALNYYCGKWRAKIKDKYPDLYSRYIEEPSFASLRHLAKIMRKHELIVNSKLQHECCEPEPIVLPDGIQSVIILNLPRLSKKKPPAEEFLLQKCEEIEYVIDLSNMRYRVGEYPVDLYQVFQAAFCTAFLVYTTSNSLSDIIGEIADGIPPVWLDKDAGDTYETVATKVFGVDVFTPYACLLGNKMELIEEYGTLEQFERIFFYHGSMLKNGEKIE